MSIVAQLVGPVTGLLDKFIEDKDQKNLLAHEISTLADKQAAENALAQIEVNKIEAELSLKEPLTFARVLIVFLLWIVDTFCRPERVAIVDKASQIIVVGQKTIIL